MVPSRSVTASKPNFCFACGDANREGLRLRFEYDPRLQSVECYMRLHSRYQGATGYAHGGMIATLLDEAMAKVNGKQGIRAVTVRLNVSYLRMVPVEKRLRLTGTHLRRRGRKLYLSSKLYDGRDSLLATAKGTFLVITPNNESDSKHSR